MLNGVYTTCLVQLQVLPPRKSLRLQRIDADTGLQLPEKEPTAYSFAPVDDNPRPPCTELSLQEIVSGAEKGVELEDKKRFLSSAALSLKAIKKEGKGSFSSGNVVNQLKALQLPVSSYSKLVYYLLTLTFMRNLLSPAL